MEKIDRIIAKYKNSNFGSTNHNPQVEMNVRIMEYLKRLRVEAFLSANFPKSGDKIAIKSAEKLVTNDQIIVPFSG